MSDTDTLKKTESFALSLDGEKVRNIKFYFLDKSTPENLHAFHKKAWAQVKSGVSLPDNDFDAHLLD